MRFLKKAVSFIVTLAMVMSIISMTGITAVYAAKKVKVTSVTVPDKSLTLTVGDKYTIVPTIAPENATNKKVKYSSSKKKVAAVTSKGVVTAKKAGTAKITVKAADGSGKKATVTVKVVKKAASSATTPADDSSDATQAEKKEDPAPQKEEQKDAEPQAEEKQDEKLAEEVKQEEEKKDEKPAEEVKQEEEQKEDAKEPIQEATAKTLTSEGKTVKVSVTYGPEAQIPDNADLVVTEITGKDEGFHKRNLRLAEVLSKKYGNVTISDIRMLDIAIMVDGKEVEPKAEVEVKVEYTDALSTEDTAEETNDDSEKDYKVTQPKKKSHFVAVHYTDDGSEILKSETVETKEGITESTATTKSFSEYDYAYIYEYETYEAGDDYSKLGTIGTKSASDVSKFLKSAPALRATRATTPDHSKDLADNHDGTYTVGLSVKGSAETTAKANPVNVIIVHDVSSSMLNNYVPMATGARGSDREGSSFQLYDASRNAISDGYEGTVYRRNNNWSYSVYNGQRYSGTITRADAAEKVLYDFTHALFGYQDSSNPTNIEAALVTFSGSVSDTQPWTSTESDITGKVNSSGTGHSLSYGTGTNWEGALARAYNLINDKVNAGDKDPTYVVFITDGAPYNCSGGIGTDVSGTFGDENYGKALNEAKLVHDACDTTGGAFFSIYAFGKQTDWLASLMYYAYNGNRPSSSIEGTTFNTEGYYNAGDTSALETAIADIFEKIVSTLGVGNASISDGTTSNVSTTSGEFADLLDVDTSSFRYWLTWNVTRNSNGTYSFSRVDQTTGDNVEYTVTLSGTTATITWDGGSATYNNASLDATGTALTVEWTASTNFYKYAPPAATFTEPAVDWDLSPVKTLLDSVTYKVTFECYPTQYTMDLIADLKNEKVTYDSLDTNVKKYLRKQGNDYVLATNTNAVLTYTDTRTDDGEQTSSYTNPDPVSTSAAREISMTKDWSNILDGQQVPTSLLMHVARDGEDRYDVNLSSPDWMDTTWISYGIMTVHEGVVSLKAPGHDFSYTEPAEMDYYWELDAPIVRPMLINAVGTMLVLIEKEADVPAAVKAITTANGTVTVAGVTYYKLTIDGKVKYYKVDSATTSLKAINNRRSYLNVTKKVEGNLAPADSFFTYTIKVNNSKAANGTADNLNSDYWVWFSAWDPVLNSEVKDLDVSSNVTAEVKNGQKTGYFYVKSGEQFTVSIKAGWNIRILNIPSGTTYSIEETGMDDGFSVKNIGMYAYAKDTSTEDPDDTVEVETDAEVDVDGAKITGSIHQANTNFTITYTNKFVGSFYVYHSSDNTIEKISTDDQRISSDGTFDITAVVKDGNLYGGYYKVYGGTMAKKSEMPADIDKAVMALTYNTNGWATDSDGESYTGASLRNSKNTRFWLKKNAYTAEKINGTGGKGTEMTPLANTVYYLKEVPDEYLHPYTLWIYNWDKKTLDEIYFIGGVDDTTYNETGTILKTSNHPATYLVSEVNITRNNEETTYSVPVTIKETEGTLVRGYLSVFKSSDIISEFDGQGPIKQIAYWITPDDVLVQQDVGRTVEWNTENDYNVIVHP